MNIELDFPMALVLLGVGLVLYAILGGRIRKIAVIELDPAAQDLDRRQRTLVLLLGAGLLIGGVAWKVFTLTLPSGQVAQATVTPVPSAQETPSLPPESAWEAIPFARADGQLGEGWSWHTGESPDSGYSLSEPNSLTMVAGPLTDHWKDIDSAPRLEYGISGDFEVQVRVDFQPAKVQTQHAGLLVISGSDPYTWIRISRCFDDLVPGQDGIYAIGDQGGQGIRLASRPYTRSIVYLKIARRGSQFSLYHSDDGQEWSTLQPAYSLEMPAQAIVALEVFSALNDQAATATFSDLQIR